VYLADFQSAASSVTEPASQAAMATYESARGQTTVTSQVNGIPACQGMRERLSGRFLSKRLRPRGSFETRMPAETMARANPVIQGAMPGWSAWGLLTVKTIKAKCILL